MSDIPYFNAEGHALLKAGEIRFFNTIGQRFEILRISKDGVWVNPDVPVEETARLFLDRIAYNIKDMVATAVAQEREACAQVCDAKAYAEYETGKVDHNEMGWTQACAEAIRARGER